MGLNTQNTDAISFKKLNGKAHTQQNFALSEESKPSSIQLSYTTVFSNPIEKLPVTNSGLTTLYSTNGIVERIKFEIDIIPDTLIAAGRSQGYALKLPSDYTTNGFLKAKFSGGTYLYNSLGKLQIVPAIFGELKPDGTTEYDPILYQTNGVTQINKFSSINWFIDTYDGVLFVQDPPVSFDISAARPGFLEAFLYVGDYMDDILNNVISGNTGTTASNVGGGVGVFKTKVLNDFKFKTFLGTNGIAVNGTTDNVVLSYTGSTGTTVTANNGLTKSGNNIRLGGTLTGNTLIRLNNKSLTITGATTGSTIQFGSVLPSIEPSLNTFNVYAKNIGMTNFASDISNAISISDDYVQLAAQDNGSKQASIDLYRLGGSVKLYAQDVDLTTMELTSQTIIVNGNYSGFTGIRYADDYSSSFIGRSLPDVDFVTGLTNSSVVNLFSGSTQYDIPFILTGVTGSKFGYDSNKLKWIQPKNTLIAGNNQNIQTPTIGNSIFVGEGNTVTSSLDWVAFFGDVNNISNNNINNELLSISAYNITGGNVNAGLIVGASSTISGVGIKSGDIIAGSQHKYNVTTLSGFNAMFGEFNTISGSTVKHSFQSGKYSEVNADGAFVHGYGITTRHVIASGIHAINMSATDGSQTLGHGVLSDYSAIIGGINHHIPSGSTYSAILGGNAIKVATGVTSTVHLPKIRFGLGNFASLTTNNTNTNVLVRNSSNGEIELRNVSTIGSGATTPLLSGGTQYDIPFILTGVTGNRFGYDSNKFKYIQPRNTLIVGNNQNIQTPSVGSGIYVGENNTVTANLNWTAFFGDVNSIGSSMGNSIISTSQLFITGGSANGAAIFGAVLNLTGAGTKSGDIMAGSHHTYNVSTGVSGKNVIFGEFGTITGGTVRYSFQSGQYSEVNATGGFVHGLGITSRHVIAAGSHAINMSTNTASQSLRHGNYAADAAIIGGRDHHITSGNTRAVILGGDAIKLTGSSYSNFVAVPSLAVFTTPTTNNAATNLLTWNSTTKKLEVRSSSTFSNTGSTNSLISGGTQYDIPFILTGITGNRFGYDANKLKWIQPKNTLIAGNNQNIINPSVGDSIFVGENNTVTGSLDWVAFFGDVNNFSANINNTILDVSAYNISGGQVSGAAYFGAAATLSGAGGKNGDFMAGAAHLYSVTTLSNFNTFLGSSHILTGTSYSNVTLAGTHGEANASTAVVFGNGISTRKVLAAGSHAINMSTNTGAQTYRHGNYAADAAIIGGRNHHITSGNTRSAIIGGDAIKLTGSTYSDYVIVPNLALWNTPSNGVSNDILIYNATTKKVETRTISSITGGSGGDTTGTMTIVTGNTTLSNGSNFNILVVTTGSSKTVTLPASPTNGKRFLFKDATGDAFTNNIIIGGNGKTIDGDSSFTIDVNYGAISLIYNQILDRWLIISFVNI